MTSLAIYLYGGHRANVKKSNRALITRAPVPIDYKERGGVIREWSLCNEYQYPKSHNVLLEVFNQHFHKLLAGEQRRLVELFLLQVKVVMHGLHQCTKQIDTGMSYAIILPSQSLNNFASNRITETRRKKIG